MKMLAHLAGWRRLALTAVAAVGLSAAVSATPAKAQLFAGVYLPFVGPVGVSAGYYPYYGYYGYYGYPYYYRAHYWRWHHRCHWYYHRCHYY